MKELKITLLAIYCSCLISCSSSATFLANQVYIGMPIADFISLSQGKARLESMNDGMTIYRATDTNADRYVTNTKFFYFDSNGKLVKMDGGELRQTRQQIEIIKK